MWKKIINWFKTLKSNDPVYSCKVYKRHKHSHVDGMLCDMRTCNILDDYKTRELEQQLDIKLKDRIDELPSER